MSISKSIGGDRLGSGNRMEVEMHGFQRSNHDLSYLWKSSMSAGTLVPFLNIIGLPGDTFDINLNSIVKTLPTVGPMFGSFKVQLDVFKCPIRLYNRQLHNNKLGVGKNLSQIKFPYITMTGDNIDETSVIPPEFQHINQSSIFAYLGIRGLGHTESETTGIQAQFNGLPYLCYWDIFKNYYSNKMETNAYVVHMQIPSITSATIDGTAIYPGGNKVLATGQKLRVKGVNLNKKNIQIYVNGTWMYLWGAYTDMSLIEHVKIIEEGTDIEFTFVPSDSFTLFYAGKTATSARISPDMIYEDSIPNLSSFPLENLDLMREAIMAYASGAGFPITSASMAPYGLPLKKIPNETWKMYALGSQEGLAVKTYQSDIFNNWINTSYITGANSIAELSKVDTTSGSFTIDALNLAQKVYNFLNRIVVSGGTYEDYIEVSYDHKSPWRAEVPVYEGGLSKELTFNEVVSTVEASSDKPQGNLTGKGVMTDKHKGGSMIVKCDEPCVIMGIISLTPRLDYTQGNDWTVNLKTLADLHVPGFDGIGYQDLITQQMAFWDVNYDNLEPVYKSAGKQPAWLNYMTATNKAYGTFADDRAAKFMILDRNYKLKDGTIEDLTTYIDPRKFNYAFAQNDLTAQNYWVQVGCNIQARRKMSYKLIPNL